MRLVRGNIGLVLALLVGASIVLSGCGGGGGSGGGGSTQTAVINNIAAQGVPTPLWQNINGSPTPAPVCPQGVFLNSSIVFDFSAAVDASSVPQTGLALGSINIVDAVWGAAAIGTFTVVDLPPPASPGNHRRVLFAPTPPGSTTTTCMPGVSGSSGLTAGSTYQISVPQGGSSPQVLIIGSQPIQNSATTCFLTCGCPLNPSPCVLAFTDPIPGPPYVVSTSPATSNPPPAPVDPATIPNNTIQILVSEALDPAGITLSNVRIINSATGAQVPGTIVFHQAGSTAGLTINSRIDYVASSPLVVGITYQILFGPGVVDFGGLPIQPVQGNPSALLLFQTTPANFCPQPPLVETFDTIQFKDTVTGALQWAGNGFLQTTFPLLLTGTGSDGAFSPGAGTTVLDTNQLVGGSSRMGFWDFTNVTIPTGATIRFIGPYLVHIRCTGSFTLLGTIDINAGMMAFTSPNAFDRGPEQGLANNGNGVVPVNCEANGGLTSAGGGIGGAGSGVTPPPASQCTTRALTGENGFGPTINGALNPGNPSNIFYGGGQGGDGGCLPFTVATAGCAMFDLGGLGGAGGSSGRQGEDGTPRQSVSQCIPTLGVTQPIAHPTPVPVAFTPPVMNPSAGSGGGGGGDHLKSTGVSTDDQGGGAGGGGGGIRITCVGNFAMGNASFNGTINSRGAQGANTNMTNSGAGGSGSGGEVWVQAFGTVTITPNSVINVDGPARLLGTFGSIGCTNQASGGGGDGLVQLEAGQGPTPTNSFMLMPAPTPMTGAVFSTPPFQFAGGVVGQATSLFRHVGFFNPTYTGASESFTLGNAPNTTLTIRYEGEFEAVNSTPGNPVADPATLKSMATGGGPITAANLSELNGYPFIRFIVNVSYAAPPTTASNAILPQVDTITINFNSPTNCP